MSFKFRRSATAKNINNKNKSLFSTINVDRIKKKEREKAQRSLNSSLPKFYKNAAFRSQSLRKRPKNLISAEKQAFLSRINKNPLNPKSLTSQKIKPRRLDNSPEPTNKTHIPIKNLIFQDDIKSEENPLNERIDHLHVEYLHNQLIKKLTFFRDLKHLLDLNFEMIKTDKIMKVPSVEDEGEEKPESITDYVKRELNSLLRRCENEHYNKLAYSTTANKDDLRHLLRDCSKVLNGMIIRLRATNLSFFSDFLEYFWKFLVFALDRVVDLNERTIEKKYEKDIVFMSQKVKSFREQAIINSVRFKKAELKLIHQIKDLKEDKKKYEEGYRVIKDKLDNYSENVMRERKRFREKDLYQEYLKMQKDITDMQTAIKGVHKENNNQTRMIKQELVSFFMMSARKNFRSRCKSSGTQTELSLCEYIDLVSLYGVQEHIFQERDILNWYKHPFLPYLTKDFKNLKMKVEPTISLIEEYLDRVGPFVKKGQNLVEVLVVLMRKDMEHYSEFCKNLSGMVKNLVRLVEKDNNYGNAMCVVLGVGGHKMLSNEKMKEFLKFRKFLKECLPAKMITLDALKEKEFPLSEFQGLFSDKKSFFYGGGEAFKSKLLGVTSFKFNFIGDKMMIDKMARTKNNPFIISLLELVQSEEVKSFKYYLKKLFLKHDEVKKGYIPVQKMAEVIQNTFMVNYKDPLHQKMFKKNIIEDRFMYKNFIEDVLGYMFHGMEQSMTFTIGDYLYAALLFISGLVDFKSEMNFTIKNLAGEDDFTFKAMLSQKKGLGVSDLTKVNQGFRYLFHRSDDYVLMEEVSADLAKIFAESENSKERIEAEELNQRLDTFCDLFTYHYPNGSLDFAASPGKQSRTLSRGTTRNKGSLGMSRRNSINSRNADEPTKGFTNFTKKTISSITEERLDKL